jgi:hypothetical protein
MKYDLTPSEQREVLPPPVAIGIFLETWDRDTCYDVGCSLTCHEAEALCDLFAAHQMFGHADALRAGHITGDDSGDLNHNTGDEWSDEELEALPEGAHDTSCVHSS